jgi:hypothetical protein
MNKCLETNVVAVFNAIFSDCVKAYPKLELSLLRDRQTIASLVEHRGISSLMMDLPELDSWLLSGLRSGHLLPSGPLSKRVSKTVRVPRLLSGLWLLVFDKYGILRSEPDVNAIMFIRQVSCLVKSLELKCSPDRISNTVGEYYDIESELRQSDILWSDDVFDDFNIGHTLHFRDCMDDAVPDNGTESISELELRKDVDRLQKFCDSVSCALGEYRPYDFTNEVGMASTNRRYLSHGRGAVSDQRRDGNRYHFPSWNDRLQQMFPFDAFASYSFEEPTEQVQWNKVPVSKLIAVPKNLSKPRLIASETVSNQWCQQVTLKWMVERFNKTSLRRFIDLSDQGKSQALVASSSVDGSLATVDLSSASDRLSCWAIERAFRKNKTFLMALQSHRTPFIRDAITNRDDISLKKFASQGTAVTFPVQTLFFLCCVAAALGCTKLRQLDKFAGQVRVYGDDIILPVHGYERLVALLNYLQLKVNERKSFSTGNFRESCGMDCYSGYDITPVKPKQLVSRGPESQLSLIDSSNNLFKKGFWSTSECLRSIAIDERLTLPIVGMDSGVKGWASFCGEKWDHMKLRWNHSLHRVEAFATTFSDVVKRKPVFDNTAFFQFLAECPQQEQSWESGTYAVPRLRKRSRWVDTGK